MKSKLLLILTIFPLIAFCDEEQRLQQELNEWLENSQNLQVNAKEPSQEETVYRINPKNIKKGLFLDEDQEEDEVSLNVSAIKRNDSEEDILAKDVEEMDLNGELKVPEIEEDPYAPSFKPRRKRSR